MPVSLSVREQINKSRKHKLALALSSRFVYWLHVITAAEVLLQPDVQTDKKVTAAHFLNLEFSFAGSPVAPCDRDYRPGVPAHDRLERKLYREVEVWSNQWPASINDCFAICFESIGRVIQFYVEEQLQKFIS